MATRTTCKLTFLVNFHFTTYLKKTLHSFLVAAVLAFVFIGCKPISIQTTQYIQQGDNLANENNFDQARVAYLQYLKLGSKLGIYRNELLEAETHRKLAYVYSAKAKYDSSIVQLNAALAKDLKFPDNQTNILSDITELALLKAYKGNYILALEQINRYEDSLNFSLRKNSDRKAFANLLLAKARIEFTLGEYLSSEHHLLECLKIIDAYPFDVEKAEAKYLLGILYKEQGRIEESQEQLASAISILKKVGLNASLQFHAQGDQLFQQGFLEQGIVKHIEALQEAEESNILPLIIRSNTFLGEAYEFIGDRKKADFHFLKAIELQKELINLGFLESPLPKKGDIATMMYYYQQTGQKSSIAKASIGMADYFKTKGAYDSSLFYLNQASSFFARNLQETQRKKIDLKRVEIFLETGVVDSAKKILNTFSFSNQTQSYVLPYLKGRYAQMIGNSEEAKVQLRNALITIEDTRSSFSISSLRANYLGNKNYVYEEMINVLLKPQTITYQDVLEAYDWNERARSRSFLDILASKKAKPIKPIHAPILNREQTIRLKLIKLNEEIEKNQLSEDLVKRFQEVKSKHTAIVDSIVSIDPHYSLLLQSNISTLTEIRKGLKPNELLLQYWIGSNHAYVWHASRDTAGFVRLAFKETELEREITALRNVIRLNLPDQIKYIASKLYTRLLAPIPNLSSYSNLIIIPHRSQNFIPFEALQAPSGAYLIQSHSIFYAPSGTIFLAKRRANMEPSSNLLAMALGNETYGSYEALPGTVNEVQTIAKYFNPTQVKVGLASTETILKNANVDFGLIHLATHGVMNNKNPLQTFIALNADSLNDGRLTVSEIFDMTINSSLTTLSACETALGEVNRGNELIGLSTAFLYSGSKVVIVSLWKVDDRATSLLMSTFYEELAKGLPINTCMAKAQRKLLAMPAYASNPYYWSPFIVIGDGQLSSF